MPAATPKVVPAAPLPVKPVPRQAPSGRAPVWPWVTGSAGLALLAVGAGFLVDNLSAISTIRAKCPTPAGGSAPDCTTSGLSRADVTSLNAQKNRDLPIVIALGAAGGVALGAAIVGAATAPRARRTQATVGAWMGPGGGGALVRGTFE